jgi:hypothetical protein
MKPFSYANIFYFFKKIGGLTYVTHAEQGFALKIAQKQQI